MSVSKTPLVIYTAKNLPIFISVDATKKLRICIELPKYAYVYVYVYVQGRTW